MGHLSIIPQIPKQIGKLSESIGQLEVDKMVALKVREIDCTLVDDAVDIMIGHEL